MGPAPAALCWRPREPLRKFLCSKLEGVRWRRRWWKFGVRSLGALLASAGGVSAGNLCREKGYS